MARTERANQTSTFTRGTDSATRKSCRNCEQAEGIGAAYTEMRYVDAGALEIRDEWLRRAAVAWEKARDAAPADRSGVISRHSAVWTDLRAPLARLNHDKCW